MKRIFGSHDHAGNNCDAFVCGTNHPYYRYFHTNARQAKAVKEFPAFLNRLAYKPKQYIYPTQVQVLLDFSGRIYGLKLYHIICNVIGANWLVYAMRDIIFNESHIVNFTILLNTSKEAGTKCNKNISMNDYLIFPRIVYRTWFIDICPADGFVIMDQQSYISESCVSSDAN